MITKQFDDSFALQVDPDIYRLHLAKSGPIELPVHFPKNNRELTPFISTTCQKKNCIYDISNLREKYIEYNDLNETYDDEEEFECKICENNIVFKNMYTCKELYDQVKKLLGDQQVVHVHNSEFTIRDSIESLLQNNPRVFENFKASLPLVNNYDDRNYDDLIKKLNNDPQNYQDSYFKISSNLRYEYDQFPGQSVEQEELKSSFVMDNEPHVDVYSLVISYIRHLINLLYSRQSNDICILFFNNTSDFNDEPKIQVEDLVTYQAKDPNTIAQTYRSNLVFIVIFSEDYLHLYVYNKALQLMTRVNYHEDDINEEESLSLIKSVVETFGVNDIIKFDESSGFNIIETQQRMTQVSRDFFVFYFIFDITKTQNFENQPISQYNCDPNTVVEFWKRVRYCLLLIIYKNDPKKEEEPIKIEENKLQPIKEIEEDTFKNTEPSKPLEEEQTSNREATPRLISQPRIQESFNSSKTSVKEMTQMEPDRNIQPKAIDDHTESKLSTLKSSMRSSRKSSVKSRTNRMENDIKPISLSSMGNSSRSSSKRSHKNVSVSDVRTINSSKRSSEKNPRSGKSRGPPLKLKSPESSYSSQPKPSFKKAKKKLKLPVLESTVSDQSLSNQSTHLNLFRGKPNLNPENLKHFENFYSLLWYYYSYDRPKYIKIWKEYEKRFSSLILEKVGFDPRQIKKLFQETQSDFSPILNNVSPIHPNRRSPVFMMSPISNTGRKMPQKSILKKQDDFGSRAMSRSGKMSSYYGSEESKLDVQDSDLDGIIEDQLNIQNTTFKSDDYSSLPQIQTASNSFPRSPQTEFVREEPTPLNNFAPGEFGFSLAPPKFPNLPDRSMSRLNMNSSNRDHQRRKDTGTNNARDLVLSIHKKNVANYPELYNDKGIDKDKQFKSEKNGAKIFGDDLGSLQSGTVTENMISYFVRYVEDKQSNMKEGILSKYQLKAYFFTTDFYRTLIGNKLDKKYFATHFDRVRHMTNQYKGENKTIFDQFQKVIIPVVEFYNEDSSRLLFKLIVIDCIKKEIILYNPQSPINPDVAALKLAKDDKQISAIASYVEQEYYDKCYFNEDVHGKWRLTLADCSQTADISMSGLYVCLYIYTILKGQKQPFFKSSEITKFHRKLKSMVRNLKI